MKTRRKREKEKKSAAEAEAKAKSVLSGQSIILGSVLANSTVLRAARAVYNTCHCIMLLHF